MPKIKADGTDSTTAPVQLELETNLENNSVKFQLSNGTELTLREPIGKDFLLMESWFRSAAIEYRDPQIMLIKLASLVATPQIGFEQLFDSLVEFDDIERVAAAIGTFRDRLSDYFRRLENRVSD